MDFKVQLGKAEYASVSEEVRSIKRSIRRNNKKRRVNHNKDLQRYLVKVVKPEARFCHLALCFARGTPYKACEQNVPMRNNTENRNDFVPIEDHLHPIFTYAEYYASDKEDIFTTKDMIDALNKWIMED